MSCCGVVKFAVTSRQKEQILFARPLRRIALWNLRSMIAGKKIEPAVPIKIRHDKVPYPHCFRRRARNYFRRAIVEPSVSIIQQDDDGSRHPTGLTQIDIENKK